MSSYHLIVEERRTMGGEVTYAWLFTHSESSSSPTYVLVLAVSKLFDQRKQYPLRFFDLVEAHSPEGATKS